MTQTKRKIKPIKVEKIWKWILSLRVLVAYLDISDSKEAERTHQKEMGKAQEYICHIRQKSVFLNFRIPIILHRDIKRRPTIVRLASLYKKVDMDVN